MKDRQTALSTHRSTVPAEPEAALAKLLEIVGKEIGSANTPIRRDQLRVR